MQDHHQFITAGSESNAIYDIIRTFSLIQTQFQRMEKSIGQRLLDAATAISGQPSTLEAMEPYLLQPMSQACKGEIHGNDDYCIEDLSDDDLNVALHVA